MGRKPLIAGNWKMYKTRLETRDTLRRLDELIGRKVEVEVLICPPFPSLATAREAAAGSVIGIGAQDVHWEAEGAYTGEVSASMLLDCGCGHVIVGHSERRQFFGESDAVVGKKVRHLLTTSLIPILCVGESLEQRETGRVEDVLAAQLAGALEGLTTGELSRLIVAYEPIWAIGTGRTATPETAQQVHASIRAWFDKHADGVVAAGVRILYGGSVKPDNIDQLMSQPDLDGALVGGASLDAGTFARVVCYNRRS